MKKKKIESNTYNYFIKDLAIAAILLALMSAVAAFFAYGVPPFAAGYSVDPEIFIIIIGFSILNFKARFYFFILSPFFLLMDMSFYFLNPLQFFVEYILSFWVFGLCFFYKEIIAKFQKNKIALISILLLLFILSWLLKLVAHLIAGYFWWNASWLGSFILNGQFILINSAINLFIFTFLTPFLLKISLKSSTLI